MRTTHCTLNRAVYPVLFQAITADVSVLLLISAPPSEAQAKHNHMIVVLAAPNQDGILRRCQIQ